LFIDMSLRAAGAISAHSPSIGLTQGATVHHVEIRHRRHDVSLSEQLLHGENVVPIFK
jgi:hypothetical protein